MRKFFDSFIWGFLLVFSVPTVMIVASWNSLPGEPMYGMKLGLERTLLVLVSPSYTTKGTLEMKYTERRFAEAKRLLADKASVEGLVYLDNQVTTTKNVIAQAPNAKTQKDLAEAYIATLTVLSSQLEQQKKVVAPAPAAAAGAAPFRPSPPPQQGVVQQGRSVVTSGIAPQQSAGAVAQQVVAPPPQGVREQTAPAPTSAPRAPATAPQVIAAAEIARTQANIQQTIVEMKQVAKEAEKQEEKNSNKGQGQDKKEDSGNQKNKDEKKKND